MNKYQVKNKIADYLFEEFDLDEIHESDLENLIQIALELDHNTSSQELRVLRLNMIATRNLFEKNAEKEKVQQSFDHVIKQIESMIFKVRKFEKK